jgi:hypothetical protein
MTAKSISKFNEWTWKCVTAIPFAKPLLYIVNSYVWRGNPNAFFRFAPIQLYFKHLFFKVIGLLIASNLFIRVGQMYSIVIVKSPATESLDILGTALQLFPNVLGFGIGAYALLFTFPERFFENLEENKRNKNLTVGAQGLNAIMAFPLLMITMIIFSAAILKILQLTPQTADSLGLFLIAYGLLLTAELISVLFASARKVIRKSVKTSINSDATEQSTNANGMTVSDTTVAGHVNKSTSNP